MWPSVAAVAADEQVALGIGRDAVVRLRPLEALARAAPRAHEVALGVELHDRRRRHAALGLRRVGCGVDFLRLERAGAAVDDVDVILGVDADADHVAVHPVVRQRLGPHRVDFEPRRLHGALGLGRRRALEHALRESERNEQRHHTGSYRDVTLHTRSSIRDAKVYYSGVSKKRVHGSWLRAHGIGSMADRPSTIAISHQPSAMIRAALLAALFAALWVATPGRARYPGRRNSPGAGQAGRAAPPGCSFARRSRRCATWTTRSRAIRRTPDLLDLARAEATLRDAATLWISDYLDLYENGDVLPAPRVVSVRAALQSDKSFASYDEAHRSPDRARAAGPDRVLLEPGSARRALRVPDSLGPVALLDPAAAGAPGHPDADRAALPAAGRRRARLRVPRRPGARAARSAHARNRRRAFVRLGIRSRHRRSPTTCCSSSCLVIPFRRIRSLVTVVAAFTVGALDCPARVGLQPRVRRVVVSAARRHADRRVDRLHGAGEHRDHGAEETAEPQDREQWQDGGCGTAEGRSPQREDDFSAVSAVSAVSSGSSLKRRWIATFGFGLAHGFGLSLALRPALQLAGSHPLTAMLSFNAGVELGQLLVLVLLIPALALLFRYLIGERTGTIVLSALAGHTAWHWMGDRWELLQEVHVRVAGDRRGVSRGRAALDDAAGRGGGVVLAGLRRADAGREI